MSIPRSEIGTWSKRARTFHRELTEDFELTTAEELILTELCRGITRSDEITETLKDAPPFVKNRHGETVVHPGVVELRQLAIVLGRLVSHLRLPSDEDDQGADTKRPQTRTTPRGAYSWRPEVV